MKNTLTSEEAAMLPAKARLLANGLFFPKGEQGMLLRDMADQIDAKDAEIAALKEKLAAKDTEVAFLHSVRRDEQAMSESYTRPDTHSTFLLRRALKQLDRWAEKYGQWQPAWLPPGGDVTLAEDIDAHLGQAGQMPAAYLPLPANPQPIEQAPYRQGDPSFAALAVQPDYKR